MPTVVSTDILWPFPCSRTEQVEIRMDSSSKSTDQNSAAQHSEFPMLNLFREAANLSGFIYNFRYCKDVSFPKPLYPLVHPAVLVESYEHGESVLHYVDKLNGNEHIKTALAHIGTHALLKMLLVDNSIHEDMHPGNILIRDLHGQGSGKTMFKSKPHGTSKWSFFRA